ncbi:MAG: ATP-binding cassette domain-containing protein, partial [Oscillibacter sp.]|nr:ATP-binding cassette domain-containing protein [Oscillibacter sp.]
MEAFALRNVSFAYPRRQEWALSGVDLTVEQGEFLVLCGPSGCGKSTLLRQLKTDLAPHGLRSGAVLFEGRPLEDWDRRTQSQRIGFVGQSPENQLVTDKVWHELAFGLESLGYDTPAIRRRVAEMAAFFGIEDLFYKNVAELSGGQKQLVNLAAVMVLQPSVLILDEPTGQLDPIAASDFLAALGKINRELGTTIVLSEHRLEEALPLCNRAAVMEGGRILCAGTVREVGGALRGHPMFRSMPTAIRAWAAVDGQGTCPVTVREGRDWLRAYAKAHPLGPLPAEKTHTYPEEVLTAKEMWFRYEKEGADIVKGLKLRLCKGEFLAILGGNGAGKTTALKILSGLMKPYRGRVAAKGRVVLLPQDPQTVFVKKTVREDLQELGGDVDHIAALCRLKGLLDRHPYDLSGGEQQRAALAKVLLLDPDILLLDEPTKGLDSAFKETLAEILEELLAQGKSILMVSHDLDFCAGHAHRCALFFDGGIVAQ